MLDVFGVADLRWWKRHISIDFGVLLGRSLTERKKLKREKREVFWCKIYSKYNWSDGERDKFKCRIKAVSVSLYVEADRDALERSGLSSLWEW